MRLGISSYTYPWSVGLPGFPREGTPMNAIDLVRRARALGVGVLQFGDNLPLHTLRLGELQRLAQEARENGVEIEVGTYGFEADRLLQYLDIARQLDARLVRTLLPRPAGAAGVDVVVGKLQQSLPAYEAAGVILGVENYELYSAAEYAEILRRLPSPSLGMCLDTANNLGRGESVDELINAFGARVACLHVKDVRIQRIGTRMGFRVEGCPAGEGVIDIGAILWRLRTLSPADRGMSVILEQWPPEQGSFDDTVALEAGWAESSVKNLKQLLAEAGA